MREVDRISKRPIAGWGERSVDGGRSRRTKHRSFDLGRPLCALPKQPEVRGGEEVSIDKQERGCRRSTFSERNDGPPRNTNSRPVQRSHTERRRALPLLPPTKASRPQWSVRGELEEGRRRAASPISLRARTTYATQCPSRRACQRSDCARSYSRPIDEKRVCGAGVYGRVFSPLRGSWRERDVEVVQPLPVGQTPTLQVCIRSSERSNQKLSDQGAY